MAIGGVLGRTAVLSWHAICDPKPGSPLSHDPRLMSAGKRHERHGKELLRSHLSLIVDFHNDKMLESKGSANRDDHSAARLELLDQRCRNLARDGGDDDAVEWRRLLPTVIAVAEARRDVGIAEALQPLRGMVREIR